MVADGHMVTGQGCCGRSPDYFARSRSGRLTRTLLLLATLCASLPASAADSVAISAVVGYSDTFQPGRWTPLNVTVTNRSGDLQGHVEVEVTGGDELRGPQFVATHRRELELHRESRKTLQFTVFLQGLSRPLVIRVRSQGRELGRAEVDLRTRFAAGRLLLVLSRDADLDYLNDGATGSLRVVYPHPELLPVHWRGYDAVAAVVVHGVSLERLSPRQYDALHKWIAQGGILAVSGGPEYSLLRSPRLAALLPGVPEGMARIDADALQRALSSSLEVTRPVHVNRLGVFRGRANLSAGNVPLIAERTLGLGRVLYLTFDVTGYPFDRWDGMRELWLESLRLPPARPLSVADPVYENPLPPLIRAEAPNFPSPATLVYFLALYLGLLLAGYRLSSRGTGRRWTASLSSFGTPLLFAAAAWVLFGPAAFPRGPSMVSTAVIEPLPDSVYARLNLDMGVYSNRSGPLRLEYRGGEPVLQPQLRTSQTESAGNWAFGEGTPRFIEPLERRRYVLHMLRGEDVITFHLNATVDDESSGPRLVMDNASGRMLSDMWLVFDGYAYELGQIAADEKIERQLARATDGVQISETNWLQVVKPSGIPVERLAPSRILLERVSQTTRVADAGRKQALLVGYAQNPLRPAGASVGWARRDQAIVAYRVTAGPGKMAAGGTGTGAPESDQGNLKRRELPVSGRAAANAGVGH